MKRTSILLTVSSSGLEQKSHRRSAWHIYSGPEFRGMTVVVEETFTTIEIYAAPFSADPFSSTFYGG